MNEREAEETRQIMVILPGSADPVHLTVRGYGIENGGVLVLEHISGGRSMYAAGEWAYLSDRTDMKEGAA